MPEITLSNQRINEISVRYDDRIMELALDGASYNVPVDPRINVEVLIADDPDPMFVNVETIREGISRTNRRKYSADIVRQVSSMTPGVQGFLGHPDPAKKGFEFREPHCIFVGSEVHEMANGTLRAIAKAYIFKSSPLREWIPKSIAAGRPMTVSINGLGDIVKDVTNQLIIVKRLTELESIDWANPGTEGMSTSKAMSVVSEMQDKGGEEMPDLREVLQGVTIAEMRSANPELVDNIIRNVNIEELQKFAPKIIESIQEGARITEMKLTINGEEKTVKLTEMQSVIDAKEAKIQELTDEINGIKLTEYKNQQIAELVPEQYRSAVSKRVTGNTKEAIVESIKSELEFITELAGSSDQIIKPVGNVARVTTVEMETAVKNMFGVKEQK